MGAMPGQIAALKRGDIDGIIMDIGNAFDLVKRGEGRILVRFGDIKDFHIHVIFATDKAIASKPERCAPSSRAGSRPSRSCARTRPRPSKIATEVMDKDEDDHRAASTTS